MAKLHPKNAKKKLVKNTKKHKLLASSILGALVVTIAAVFFSQSFVKSNAQTSTVTPTPVPSQAWITTISYIYPFNYDGTSAGNYMNSQSYYSPIGVAVVGSEVWTANIQFGGSISRLDFTGNEIKSKITGNGINSPAHMAIVGNQVWVTNNNQDNPTHTISRFNFDGSPAGLPLKGNGLCDPNFIAVVGNQVWVTNVNYTRACGTQTIGTISRFKFDGTSAGSMIKGYGLSNVQGIAVVGTKVWVANYFNSDISLFNLDGTYAGTTKKVKGKAVYVGISGNGLNHPSFIRVVGNQVWVGNTYLSYTTDQLYEISRFNFDGTPAANPFKIQSIPYDLTIIPEH